ncbi:MAG TPA: hypothetical protein VFO16_11865 [Pseudonocardiaceae bacterium]|nr:hypothetical protein [Pseudonocardiaceae bacterium]
MRGIHLRGERPRRRPHPASRATLAVIASLALALGLSTTADAGQERKPHQQRYLMVSDGAAAKVYFYRVPDMTLTGTLSDIKLGSAGSAPAGADPAANTPMHGGVIVLPDGRLIVNDESHQRTMAIKLDDDGAPSIVNSVSSRLGTEAPWTAVDPSFRYYAVASNGGGSSPGTETLNLIDLKTFTDTQLEIPMKGTTEDLTPFFAGNPLTLFAGVGGNEMRAYNVATLLHGEVTPTGTVTMGPNSHGGFSSPATGTIGITTGPEPPNLGTGADQTPNPDNLGLDVFDVVCHPARRCDAPASPARPCKPTRCPSLENRVTVPWNADGLTFSKGNRVRVMADGEHIMTPLNVDLTPGIATDWKDVRLDAHFTDLKTKTARRITVGMGASSRGFPVSRTFAVEPIIRPKAPDGMDQLKIIDIRPDSPTYLKIVRTVGLAQMTNGPVDGIAPDYPTYERRFAAITPDGRYAFVTCGGDGKVDMVDTATGAVTTITTPTSLTGGGHITAFQLGLTPWDLSGR